MDTMDILQILSADIDASKVLRGVYPRDTFVHDIVKRPMGVRVFNTLDSKGPGERWIAVCSDRSQLIFFDTFGRHPCFYPDFYRAILKHYSDQQLKWNDTTIQHLLASTCGDYCTLFCLLWSKGWTLNRFTQRMKKIQSIMPYDKQCWTPMARMQFMI